MSCPASLGTGSAVTPEGRCSGTERRDGAAPALLLARGRVRGHGGADQLLEGAVVELLALADVDRTARVALEAGVEELLRVVQRGAAEERQLHDLLVRLARAHDPVVRPD